jgi:hypothetical protein
MLGFDAIGRLALGQLPSSGTFLGGSTGTFILTGKNAAFALSFLSSVSSYQITGNAAILTSTFASSLGAFSGTGIAAGFLVTMPSAVASYVLTGKAAVFSGSGAALGAGGYAVTVNSAILTVSLGTGGGSYALTANDAALSRDFINWVHDGAPSNQWTIKQPPPLTVVWTPH